MTFDGKAAAAIGAQGQLECRDLRLDCQLRLARNIIGLPTQRASSFHAGANPRAARGTALRPRKEGPSETNRRGFQGLVV
jgi:hypothetical protein